MPATLNKPRWKEIDFRLPVLGIHKGTAWHEVPAGFTPYMNNVFAYDSLSRLRLGQRPGLSKMFSFQFGGGAKDCQHISQVGLQDTSGGSTVQYILAVFEGRTYLQIPGDVSANAIDGGSAVWSTSRRVEAVTYQDAIYMTDGLDKKKYTLAGGMVSWTASSGTFPIASSQYPRYLASWRGRIVLSHLDKGSSGAVFFSKQGDPTNFDYGAAFDPTIAEATTTNFRAGQMPDAPTAIIPVNEDILLISTTHTIYKFVGDPADGGALVPITDNIGIQNNDAWCMVGTTLYFVGSGGFYRMLAGGEPELLSLEKYNTVFRSIPGGQVYCECVYDQERQMVDVFATRELTPFTTYHVGFHLKTQGFYPMTFPADGAGEGGADSIGPTKTTTYDGPLGRFVLLGCRDGYIRKLDAAALTDDVDQIPVSEVLIGPLQPAGATMEAMLNGMYIVAGENSSYGAQFNLLAGHDPYGTYNDYVTNATVAKTATLTTGGRANVLGWRRAANTFFIDVARSGNGKTWDLERITGRFEAAGPNR